MVTVFTSNWWALVLRGLVALLFGLLTFAWPEISLTALVFLFGAYALVDGLFTSAVALRSPEGYRHWWALLLEGIFGVVAGALAFVWPGITALVLLYLIAVWAVVTGVFEVVAAVYLRRLISGEWLLVVGGVVSVLFGVLLAVWPGAGVLAVLWLIGAYAILFGALLIALGLRLRGRVARLVEIRAVA
jgi:uncharacterized membrane protein HdeD (DUF308 family)